jgi:hypothetical protein
MTKSIQSSAMAVANAVAFNGIETVLARGAGAIPSPQSNR